MLGNRKELQYRAKIRKKRGEKSHSIAGTVLWECWWGRDLFFCSVPPSEPTSSSVDVWAICTQHARRETESKLLWRLGVCIISHAQKKKGAVLQNQQNLMVLVIHLKIKWAVWGFDQREENWEWLRFPLDCTAGKEPNIFPTGRLAKKKKSALCYEACCCRTDISVQQIPICVLPSENKKT